MTDDLSDGPIDYQRLKAATRTLRRPLKSLYALTDEADPFAAGTPGRRQAAEWIAELWPRLNFRPGVHVRRVHYKLVSLPEPPVRPNGEPYQNTYVCWKFLINAIRDARFLGLLAPNTIVDHRNPPPMIHFTALLDQPAALKREDGHAWCLGPQAELPEVNIGAGDVDVELPRVTDSTLEIAFYSPGFRLPRLALDHPPSITERYMLEVWCEKTTMNDVIVPLGQRLHVNVITGAGDMSATQCEQFVERTRSSGKPVSILHVSDFDPQGENMPVAVARKIEFSLRTLAKPLDVQLRSIVLTHNQCLEYQLPRTPLKETEHRAARWEARYGEGATELDALEAVHPGALARIISGEIVRYRDDTIGRRIRDSAAEFTRQLETVNTEVRARHAEDITTVGAAIRAAEAQIEPMRAELAAVVEPMRAELATLTHRIRDDLTALADRMRQELEHATEQWREEAEQATAPMRIALENLLARIHTRTTQIDTELSDLARPLFEAMRAELSDAAPAYEWPQPIAQEDENPLYDSKRGYLDQLDRYHEHQGKAKLTKLRNLESHPCICADCGKSFTSTKRDQILCRLCYQKHYQRKWKAQHGKAASQGTLPTK
jgi:hypothetical protein